MTLQDLKTLLNTLTEKELNQELFYNSEDHSISGVVSSIVKAKENLYYDGEDDPSRLLTKKELIEEFDLEPEDVADYSVEIPKGGYYLNL